MSNEVNFDNYLYYDETSPSALRWKVARDNGKVGRILVHAGDVAGGLTANNYWVVTLDNVPYKVHRVVMTLHGFNCKGKHIDHKDQNPSNNKIGNLRIATPKINSRNRPKSSSNTSGVVGVRVLRKNMVCGLVDLYHVAYWYDLIGIRHSKLFSILKLGREESFRMACEYRVKMIDDLNTHGAGYTPLHGVSNG